MIFFMFDALGMTEGKGLQDYAATDQGTGRTGGDYLTPGPWTKRPLGIVRSRLDVQFGRCGLCHRSGRWSVVSWSCGLVVSPTAGRADVGSRAMRKSASPTRVYTVVMHREDALEK